MAEIPFPERPRKDRLGRSLTSTSTRPRSLLLLACSHESCPASPARDTMTLSDTSSRRRGAAGVPKGPRFWTAVRPRPVTRRTVVAEQGEAGSRSGARVATVDELRMRDMMSVEQCMPTMSSMFKERGSALVNQRQVKKGGEADLAQ